MVEARLAACANVLPGMVPIFRWEGKVEEGSESVVILKTTKGRLDALVAAVEATHSYDCPCAVALPIVGGSRAFLDWIGQRSEGGRVGKDWVCTGRSRWSPNHYNDTRVHETSGC